MILLVPIDKFRVFKVKVNGKENGVVEKIGGNKIFEETMRGTYFNIRRNLLKYYGSITNILILITMGFVYDVMRFSICKNMYRFLDFLFMNA